MFVFKKFSDILPHTTKITKIPSTWCFPHLVTFVRFALFTGTDFVIRDRRRAVTVTGASYVRAGAHCYHLISGVSSLHCLSLSSLLHLYWRVLYTWCHDGSELLHLHSSSFHSLDCTYSVKYENTAFMHNYLYTCLYSLKRMYARVTREGCWTSGGGWKSRWLQRPEAPLSWSLG